MELNSPELMGGDSNEFFVSLIVGKLSLCSTCLGRFNPHLRSFNVSLEQQNQTSSRKSQRLCLTSAFLTLRQACHCVPWFQGFGRPWLAKSFDFLIRINAKHISKQVIWMIPLRIQWKEKMCVISRHYRLKHHLNLFKYANALTQWLGCGQHLS